MEDSRELYKEFEEWVLSRPKSFYTITHGETEDGYYIQLETDYAQASITTHFLNFTITEFRIDLKDGDDSAFYLHFELKDLEHAKELFYEMIESLKDFKDHSHKKVLLCCSCGLTTSYFMMNLNEASELMGLDMEFNAMSVNEIYEHADEYDAILVAPQIGYEVDKIAKVLSDKIVIRVPAQVFATYDAHKMIEILLNEFENRKQKEEAEERELIAATEQKGSDLILSVVSFTNRVQISYRVYNHGERIVDNQIVKKHYKLADLEDIIGSVLLQYTDIDTIRIVTPGTIHEGRLTYAPDNMNDANIKETFEERFGVKVLLINNVNAMAWGYRFKEEYEGDFALYFVPTGATAGSFGIVNNNFLILGKHGIAGERIEDLVHITTFGANPYFLAKTPEGNTQLASRYIVNLINFVGPQRVVVYGSLIYDIDELRKQVGEFVDEEFMPEFIKVDSVREYLFTGALNMPMSI